jgi:hypothetical protein
LCCVGHRGHAQITNKANRGDFMDISELTKEHMKEIMWNVYKKGNESQDIGVKELIEEIKQQIISVLRSE